MCYLLEISVVTWFTLCVSEAPVDGFHLKVLKREHIHSSFLFGETVLISGYVNRFLRIGFAARNNAKGKLWSRPSERNGSDSHEAIYEVRRKRRGLRAPSRLGYLRVVRISVLLFFFFKWKKPCLIHRSHN